MLPKHVAFICDGNRRWAKAKGLPEFSGHKHAVDVTVEALVDHCIKLNLPYVTFWFFSTENWRRGDAWVTKYFNLFRRLMPTADKYIKKGVRLNVIGDLTKLPADLQTFFNDWKEKSKTNTKITLTIAFNYGGRDEIIRAINKIKSFPISEAEFSQFLDTADLPNPELLIRTGKDNTRLSGFMLWQLAYAQLYFCDILFPDFSPQKLDEALYWWQTQTNNLGK